jgi:hypothetical protein
VRRFLLVAALFASQGACKKFEKKTTEVVPDAGVVLQIGDADLGFHLELEKGWFPKPIDQKAKSDHVLGEALRAPTKGHAYFVAPRIVVSAEPTDVRDSDELLRRTIDDLKHLDDKPGVRVKRRATSTRYVDGVKVGDVEISYEVKDAKQDAGKEVVQRSLAMLRTQKDKRPAAITVTVSYMADDAETVAPEVHTMLNSLAFAHDDAAGPRVSPRSEVVVTSPDAGAARAVAVSPSSAKAPPPDDEDETTGSPAKKKKHKRKHPR